MGRPINKRYFGAVGSATAPHIPIRFKTGGSVLEGHIAKQKGSRTFLCSAPNVSPPALNVRCKLVQGTNSDPVNDGEATLVGLLNGSPKTLQKLSNKIAVDFNGVRYKWTLEDDSTQTLLILTAM